MKFIILPTFDLVEEYMQYDPAFLFLDNGIKDVIKASAVSTGFRHRASTPPTNPHHTKLMHHILEKHEQFTTKRQDLMPCYRDGASLRGDLGDYLARIAEIEYVTVHVEEEMRALMARVLKTRLYEIDSRASYWHGQDLVIRVRSL